MPVGRERLQHLFGVDPRLRHHLFGALGHLFRRLSLDGLGLEGEGDVKEDLLCFGKDGGVLSVTRLLVSYLTGPQKKTYCSMSWATNEYA